jgi:hypothetical protein
MRKELAAQSYGLTYIGAAPFIMTCICPSGRNPIFPQQHNTTTMGILHPVNSFDNKVLMMDFKCQTITLKINKNGRRYTKLPLLASLPEGPHKKFL